MYIYGKNPVKEAIKANKVKKIYLLDSFKDNTFINLLGNNKNIIERKGIDFFNKIVNKNINHQGIIANVIDYKYFTLDEILLDSKKITNPILIMLDGIEDPHNLGAILRIIDAFDALGVIIKNNNQVKLNDTVAKVSAGAINYTKVINVSNLNMAIKKLKEFGFWIIATDGSGSLEYDKVDVNSPIVIVIGSEGRGVSHLIKENSDYIVKIPMLGHVNSLNASNSLAVILSNFISRRNK